MWLNRTYGITVNSKRVRRAMKKAGLQSIALFKTFYNTKMLVYGVLQIVKRLHRKTLKTFYLHMIQRYNCANLAIRSAVAIVIFIIAVYKIPYCFLCFCPSFFKNRMF